MQRSGGFAELYLAVVNLIGMVIFLVVLDYPSMTGPAQRVSIHIFYAYDHP